MSENTYKFDVKMTCSGCSGAITRVLEKAKADGVTFYNVDLENQEVLVKGSLPYDDVLARIKKTGKEESDNSVIRLDPKLTNAIGTIWDRGLIVGYCGTGYNMVKFLVFM